MLLNLQRQNYTTWARKVRNVLYKSGFGVVLEMQGVGNVNLFIKEFKLRLIDCFNKTGMLLWVHTIFITYTLISISQ